MEIFVFWVIIIVILLGGYTYHLLRNSPKGFRLQIKLTIIFFLLVLIPTVPLLFVVSGLLTQGVEMFLLPGIEQSLSQSLQTIKIQMEDKGRHFLQNNPDWSNIKQEELKKYDLLYAGRYKIIDNEILSLNELLPNNRTKPNIEFKNISMIYKNKLRSNVVLVDSTEICEVYKTSQDSTVSIVGYYINYRITQAKDSIIESLRVYTSLSLLKKSVIEGRLIWGLATLFIIILAIVAIQTARTLSRGISEPIQQLATGMQQVASGDLSSRVVVKAKDEIKILIDSFNKMAQDLKISQEKLVKAERLAAWRDIARRISHEIKNSLTPIQISLHRIKSKYFKDDQTNQNELILIIQDEVESLKKVSEEFSQFARLPQIKREKNDLNEIIQGLIPLIEGGSKPINIKKELDNTIPELMLDRDQIKRVLHNLMKNAVEASEIGSRIIIKTSNFANVNKSVKIEIEDKGQGISEEQLSKIFEPYFSTKKRGMGLGLSIVKRIIVDHDGTINFKSKKGAGTLVTIIL